MQIFYKNNLEQNLLNKAECFQNPYAILRDRRAGINYALRLFALVLTTLFINSISAEPLFSKENYYPNYSKENHEPKYSYESAHPVYYEPGQPKHEYQKAEYSYIDYDSYLLSYLYYLWHWIWCNIVLILIIAIIVWLIFRWYCRNRINAEFAAAAAGLPAAGDLTVGNTRFMLGTLRNSLPF